MIRTNVKYVEGGITYNKLCTGCHVMQPVSLFSVDNRIKDGLRSQCKKCDAIHTRNNKPRRQQKYQDNREECLEISRKYRAAHKKEIAEQKRKYGKEHKEEKLEQNRKYRKEHKEEVAEYQKKYHADHKEELAKQKKNYRIKYKEKVAKRKREYHQKNKDKALAANHRRRVRKLGNGPVEYFTNLEIFERDGWICQICKLPVDPTLLYLDSDGKVDTRYQSLDHIIPLSRGGTHTRSNVQLSHLFCNISKNAKIYEEDE